MQLSDIVDRLMAYIPRRTTQYSTNVAVVSLSYDDVEKEVTCITTSANTITTGDRVVIRDAKTPYAVNTIFRNGSIAVAFTTNVNQAVDRTIEIAGANESEYNGTHNVTDFPTYDIDSISVTGGVCTITSANHGIVFDTNLQIEITGIRQPQYNRVVPVTGVTTNTLTFALPLNVDNGTVKNGSSMQFKIVPNKYNVAFTISGTPSSPATGTIFIFKKFLEGYNGLKTVTEVVNDTTFKYSLDANFESPAQGTIIASYDFRMTGSASLERAVEHYSTSEGNNPWIYVTIDDEIVSRNRQVQNDADVMIGEGNTYFQTSYQTFNLYLMFSTASTQIDSESNSKNILARVARDFSLKLKPIIYKSVAGYRFDSELTESKYQPCVPTNNGTQETQVGYYIHRYSFMVVGYLLDADYIDSVDTSRLEEMDFDINNTGLNIGINY